jgi:fluoroacetyl-CoA thioesterase
MTRPGLSANIQLVVSNEDTATALGSGDVPVLGTPRLLAAFEAATVAAIREHLGPGQTSVGTRASLEHQRAVPVGDTVDVTAHVVAVDGRLLRFDVAAQDAGGRVVASGQVTRVVVDRDRFLAGVQSESA